MQTLAQIIFSSVSLLVTLAVPVAVGYWYGYEKGKADGLERKP
jgi:hypothetical protein